MFSAARGDIDYVFNQIHNLHNSSDLFRSMDLNNIGVFGHSLGADTAMYLGHTQDKEIKAVVALDPYDAPELGEKLNY